MKIYLCLLSICLSVFSLQAQKFEGDWEGILNAAGQELQLVFHIENASDGFSTTMDSPDQNAFGIAMQTTKITKDSVKIKAAFMEYNAKWKNDSLIGVFKQNGMQFPLKLSRDKLPTTTKESSKPKRPQTPKAPFPYTVKEVRFFNKEDSIHLAGTLTLPENKTDFPSVILVSGSGPQDRDETILRHKPFLVLADYLTKNGIGVLRYDDRGAGKSEGDFISSDAGDFAKDAQAAITFLQKQPEINADKIGVLGHSEGGLVGSMLAGKNTALSFLILMAAPAVNGKDLMLQQLKDITSAQGMSLMQIAPNYNLNKEVFDIIINTPEPETKAALVKFFKEERNASEEEIKVLLQQYNIAFLKYIVRSKPSELFAEIQIPVLALNGEKDLQINAEKNLAAIKGSFTENGNKKLTIKRYEDLNHLFQTAETGLPKNYGKIEETLAPIFLEDVKEWILKLGNN